MSKPVILVFEQVGGHLRSDMSVGGVSISGNWTGVDDPDNPFASMEWDAEKVRESAEIVRDKARETGLMGLESFASRVEIYLRGGVALAPANGWESAAKDFWEDAARISEMEMEEKERAWLRSMSKSSALECGGVGSFGAWAFGGMAVGFAGWLLFRFVAYLLGGA